MYEPGRVLLQGRLRGAGGDGPADRLGGPRGARREAARGRERVPREGRGAASRSSTSPTTRCARPRAPTCRCPRRPSGASRRSRSTSTRSTATSTRTCCSSCTGVGRASKARPGRRCCAMTSARAWSGCGASRTTCTRARCSASSPATRSATRSSCSTPRIEQSELTRFVCPRQPKGDRICLADFFRPAVDGAPPPELDVIAVQAVTVGSEVTELMAKLEAEGRVRRAAVRPRTRRADRRGPGRVAALRARARCSASRPRRDAATRGAIRPCPSSQST